jgi:hypothetical protein
VAAPFRTVLQPRLGLAALSLVLAVLPCWRSRTGDL